MAAISFLAGKPAPPSTLVDTSKLLRAYYDRHPDPSMLASMLAWKVQWRSGWRA